MEQHDAQPTNDRKPSLDELYAVRTPLFERFYRAGRKRIRFPRYYKRALNW